MLKSQRSVVDLIEDDVDQEWDAYIVIVSQVQKCMPSLRQSDGPLCEVNLHPGRS